MKMYKFNFTQNLPKIIAYKNALMKAGDSHFNKAANIIIKMENGRILGTDYTLIDGATFGVAKAYANRGAGIM